MATMRDCRFESLRAQGFTGTTSDMLEQWLLANGGARGDENGDLFRSMLISQGVAPAHVKDMWYEFLGSLGYTGALRDREYQFWCAGGIIEPPVPATFGTWVDVSEVGDASGYAADDLWQPLNCPSNQADFDIYTAAEGDVLTGMAVMLSEIGSETNIALYEINGLDQCATLVATTGLFAAPNSGAQWYSVTLASPIPLVSGTRYGIAATHGGEYNYPEIGGGDANVYNLLAEDTPVDNPTFERVSEWCRPMVAAVNNATLPTGTVWNDGDAWNDGEPWND